MANTSKHGSEHGKHENTGNQAKSSTMEKARDTASAAVSQARDVAAGLTDKAREVASNVREQAGNLAGRASEVATEAGRRAEDALSAVGGQMHTLAGTIRQNAPREGALGTAAEAVAGTLESGSSYLEEHGLGDMTADLEAVVRRYPLPSVLAGFGLGFLLARTLRR